MMREFVRRLKPFIGHVCGWFQSLVHYDPHELHWEALLAGGFMVAWSVVTVGIAGITAKMNVPFTLQSVAIYAVVALILLAPLSFEWIKFRKRVDVALIVLDTELFVYGLFIFMGEVRLVWPDPR